MHTHAPRSVSLSFSLTHFFVISSSCRCDGGVADTFGSTSVRPRCLSFTCGQNRISQRVREVAVYARAHTCTIWPRGCDWPRRHVRPPLPNMAAYQSPPPCPTFTLFHPSEDARRSASLDSRNARAQYYARNVRPSDSGHRSRRGSPSLDRPREICYDSPPPKSRVIRVARVKVRAAAL